MSRRQQYKRRKQFNPAVFNKLTIPGEPMIYSAQEFSGFRELPDEHWRNQQWYSLLRCQFINYTLVRKPVVILVRFYVSPPSSIEIDRGKLKREKTPALESHEICDYLLSFQQMLFIALFEDYRQVVKIDAEKFYSNDPRTEFQYMSWENYVEYQNNYSLYAEAKDVRKDRKMGSVQSERSGDEEDKGFYQRTLDWARVTLSARPIAARRPLSDASSKISIRSKKKEKAPDAAHAKTRWRQLGKVPQ